MTTIANDETFSISSRQSLLLLVCYMCVLFNSIYCASARGQTMGHASNHPNTPRGWESFMSDHGIPPIFAGMSRVNFIFRQNKFWLVFLLQEVVMINREDEVCTKKKKTRICATRDRCLGGIKCSNIWVHEEVLHSSKYNINYVGNKSEMKRYLILSRHARSLSSFIFRTSGAKPDLCGDYIVRPEYEWSSISSVEFQGVCPHILRHPSVQQLLPFPS